jgi:hypothetical protein
MAGKKKGDDLTIEDCVLHTEMAELMTEIKEMFKDHAQKTHQTLEGFERKISVLTEKIDDLDKRLPVTTDGDASVQGGGGRGGNEEEDIFREDEAEQQHATRAARQRDRTRRNHQGMGGNNQNRTDDPFAKVKFTIPSFSGAYDAEAYLDWEMTVEQKFNSHLVPEIHRVRQATSEFKDFAIIWWNELVNSRLQPDSWARLKDAIRTRFVPPSYQRDVTPKFSNFKV